MSGKDRRARRLIDAIRNATPARTQEVVRKREGAMRKQKSGIEGLVLSAILFVIFAYHALSSLAQAVLPR